MKTKKYFFVGLAAVIANAFVCCDFDSVFAHTATLTTSGTVTMDVAISGNQANIGTDNVVVNSTCPLGYTLSIAGPTDNTLYKGGDNTNNASDQTISASSGTVATPASILGNNLGTWGYTTTNNATINSNFIGLTNTATTIATKNSASATGGDTVAVYYGASVTATTEPGLYKLAESTAGAGDNVITYYLTASPNCNSYIIRYNDNGANSATTMGDQTIAASATTVDLWPSNFQRSGYGFAGWNTKANGTGTNYGPMETIDGTALQTLMSQAVVENGYQVIKLYAKWVQSAGNIQSWTGCSSLASGAVTALTDTRDSNTYAVAKLADGKCWMIENMRIDNSVELAASTTNGPSLPLTNDYATSTTSNYLSASSNTATSWCSTASAECYDQSRLRTDNTSLATTANSASDNIYSYGNYYNWYSATAGNGKYSDRTTNANVYGSVCPLGWALPRGGNDANAANNDFRILSVAELNGALPNDTWTTNHSRYSNVDGGTLGTEASMALRKYPNNFVLSGSTSGSNINNRGVGGYYWTSTVRTNYAYNLAIDNYTNYAGANHNFKYYGMTMRCVSGNYTVNYNANGGSGTMSAQSIALDKATALTNNSFTHTELSFLGWNTKADGTGTSYTNGQSVTNIAPVFGSVTLYAQWGCVANRVCYSDNGANSATTMSNQTVSSTATSVTLWPSNFQRSNYGFAGWNTKADGTGTNYGPMETIAITAGQFANAGLQLYAKWVQSAGNIQSWTGCSSLASGAVTALKDTRDNNVYAVAKLADGKCWMIENLRLSHTASNNSTGTSAQGYGGVFAGLANSESANFSTSTTANSLYSTDGSGGTTAITGSNQGYRFPRYNNSNTNSTVTNMTTLTNANIYSYGNYYTWVAALANTTNFSSETATDGNGKTSETANTSICPSGWRLPYGRNTGNGNTPGGFYYLNYKLNNDSNVVDDTASEKIRSYPNNFLYSGLFSNSSATNGTVGYYWSSIATNARNAYYLFVGSSSVDPGTDVSYKYYARAVRCVAGS